MTAKLLLFVTALLLTNSAEAALNVLANNTTLNFDSKACGTKKQCLGYPANCERHIESCQALMMWTVVRVGDKSYMDVEMLRVDFQTKASYLAISFSKDTKMTGNPYEACFRATNDSQNLQIGWGYLHSYKAPEIVNSSFPVTDYITMPVGSISYKNGFATMKCRYRRLMTLSNTMYQLLGDSKRYYALGAFGVMRDPTTFRKHEKRYFTKSADYVSSSNAPNFTWVTLILVLVARVFLNGIFSEYHV